LQQLATQRGVKVSRPSDYLLSVRGGEIEGLLLITQVELVARSLSLDTDVAADAILQPEASFEDSRRAPPGRYVCLGCGQGYLVSVPSKIGLCPVCGTRTRCPTCGHVASTGSRWRRLII
jgi:hypothetical protein